MVVLRQHEPVRLEAMSGHEARKKCTGLYLHLGQVTRGRAHHDRKRRGVHAFDNACRGPIGPFGSEIRVIAWVRCWNA